MELVKKNLFSIICGVVALAALVALFVVFGWYDDFQTKLAASKTSNDTINTLMKQPRLIPAPDPNGNAVPLNVFPNERVHAAGDTAMTKVHTNAQNLMRTAVDLNRKGHEVLWNGALPRPASSTSEAFAFKDQYKKVMLPGGKPTPRTPGDRAVPENIPDGILRSAAPPSEADIEAAKKELYAKNYEHLVIPVDRPSLTPGGPPQRTEMNRQEINAKFAVENADFAEKFRAKRAEEFKIYMEPDALVLSARMDPMGVAGGQAPTSEDMWYAQMGVWVQTDIARAIREMNNATGPNVTGVQKSPVKHLIAIEMPAGFDMYKTIGAVPGAIQTAGAPPPAPPEGQIPQVFTTSVTGRVCNSTYDVVHSSVTVVIDERSVEPFIRLMRSNDRMITVLDVDKVKVDSDMAKEAGYDYGANIPVVRLTLQLEHLFMRGWTALAPNAPMPTEVKTYLGVQAAPADPTAPIPVATR